MLTRLLSAAVALGLLNACSPDASAWRKAEESASTESYAAFLAEHPASKHAPQARAALFTRFIEPALAGHGAAIGGPRLAAFKAAGAVPADARDDERQAMLLALAQLAADWPVAARQTIVELKPDPTPAGQAQIGMLMEMQGEVVVRSFKLRLDRVAHMSVKAAEGTEGEAHYIVMTRLPMEKSLLNLKGFSMETVTVDADVVLPVGSGSILSFYGSVTGMPAPGWTIESAGPELPLSFVWLPEGLTYLAGSGTAAGPDGRNYRFQSLLGAGA
jgi:hypothetical protein